MEGQDTNLEKKLNVLIADDDRAIRTLLTDVLGRYTLKTVSVCDGKAALEELEKNDYHMLFTDMIMYPGVNGDELIKEIRSKSDEKYQKLKIVVMSGTEDIKNIEKYGISGFLRKPFDITAAISYITSYNPEK